MSQNIVMGMLHAHAQRTVLVEQQFDDVDDLRVGLAEWVKTYNTQWLVERLCHKTLKETSFSMASTVDLIRSSDMGRNSTRGDLKFSGAVLLGGFPVGWG